MIPSLPGYGFSGKPTAPAGTPSHRQGVGELMQRLGYTRYVAQGGDWGNAVIGDMALQQPPGLLGIHTNMPATVPPDISKALARRQARRPPTSRPTRSAPGISSTTSTERPRLRHRDEQPPADALRHRRFAGRPGGLDDRPRRPQLEMIARVFDGETEGLSRDDILDNVTLYWLTNTAISSARLYWDNAHIPPAASSTSAASQIPVAVSAFPDEIYTAPRSWAERPIPS